MPGCSLPGNSGVGSRGQERTTIRLERRNQCLGLPVEIQGISGCMLLDTGSYDTYVNVRLADEMGVKLRRSDLKIQGIAGSQGGVMEGRISASVPGMGKGAFQSLSGNHRFRAIPSEAVPGMGRHLGILGLEQLADANALVDCGTGTLTITAAGGAHPTPPGWFDVRLVKHHYGASGFMWAVPVTLGKTEGLMIVDTLAEVSVVGERFAKSAGIELSHSSSGAYGAGGWTGYLKKGTTPKLVLGGAVNLGRIEVMSSPMKLLEGSDRNAMGKAVPVVGLLGIEQLVRMRARLDCAGGVLQVAR
ncbi:pepsin/retropepsin-like aspartic protease family protein [Haloferula sp. BvORR071]|uniref:pepsin/retropepsin-like aspartic protease family protein n=1 Tax=Haloferula sp. BvORR071 TaxID=1396141 RepID=UPI002240EFC1|nr:pepsin/retropepsin-like aspartic protease family protein [Haloferula sp. BvORR071]